MNIEYFHASRFGNGAKVADHFKTVMGDRGVPVNVHHIRDVRPDRLPPADLYLFSSPGQWGKPIGKVRRFLANVQLAEGTPYALLTTEIAPRPDKNTGQMPSEAEIAKWQRVRPVMNELLQQGGLVNVAEERVYVTGIKGPLEEGWQRKVEAFAADVMRSLPAAGGTRTGTAPV